MEVLQIAQLLAAVIYVSASLSQRGLRENLKRKIQPKTKKMQQITHDCIAFSPLAFGELKVSKSQKHFFLKPKKRSTF